MFAANQNAIDSMRSYLDAASADNIVLTRAAINPIEIQAVLERDLHRESLLEKHGLPADKFIILCLGQFVDRKGRWIFLEAAQKILSQRRDVAFAWIGPEQPGGRDLERIADFKLGADFKYLLSKNVGATRLDVLTFLRAADIFVLPSLWEGLPISILEAMALRVPTISTNVNAIPEAVINRETGILIEPGTVEALTTAITRILADSELRKKIADNGREHILANFDERVTAKIAFTQYATCFSDVIQA
jgi:glycosyltransferase involved in cell wall biosynthesis